MKNKIISIFVLLVLTTVFAHAQTCNDDFCEDNSFRVFCDVSSNFNSEEFGDDKSVMFYYIEGSNENTVTLQETFNAFQGKEGNTFSFDGNDYKILYENNSALYVTINGEEFSIPNGNFIEGNINTWLKIDDKEIYYLDHRDQHGNFVIFIKPSVPRIETFDKHDTKDFLGKRITYLGELGTSPLSSCPVYHFLEASSCTDFCTPEYGNEKCEYGESIGFTHFNLLDYNIVADCQDENCGNGQCEQSDYYSCREDCAEELCDDNRCEEFEYGVCDEDCGTCGNDRCEYAKGEWMYCASDCSTGDIKVGVNILYPSMTQKFFGYTIEYNEVSKGVLKDGIYRNKSAIFEIKKDGELVEIFNSQDQKIYAIPGTNYKMYVPYGAYESSRFLVYELLPFEKRTQLTFGKAVEVGDYEIIWGDFGFHSKKGIREYGLFVLDTTINRDVTPKSKFDTQTQTLTFEDINISIKYEDNTYNFYGQNDVIIISPVYECGNEVCEAGEMDCCSDCGCEQGFACLENACIEEQCSTDEDCNDNNPCSIDFCAGTPKICSNEITACLFENECLTQELNKNKYCSNDFEILDKKEVEQPCENDFECITGFCDSVCSKTQDMLVEETIETNIGKSQIVPENYVLESKLILKNEEGYDFEYAYDVNGKMKTLTGSADSQGNIISFSLGSDLKKYIPFIVGGVIIFMLMFLVVVLMKKKSNQKHQMNS